MKRLVVGALVGWAVACGGRASVDHGSTSSAGTDTGGADAGGELSGVDAGLCSPSTNCPTLVCKQCPGGGASCADFTCVNGSCTGSFLPCTRGGPPGEGGVADAACVSLVNEALSALIVEAETCDNLSSGQCTTTVTDLCGCEAMVGSPTSSSTLQYLADRDQIQTMQCSACLTPGCPPLAGGHCEIASGRTTGFCVSD